MTELITVIVAQQGKNVKVDGRVVVVQNFELANSQNFGDGDMSPILSSKLGVLAKDSLTKDVMGKPRSRNQKKSPPSAGCCRI